MTVALASDNPSSRTCGKRDWQIRDQSVLDSEDKLRACERLYSGSKHEPC